MAMMLTTKTIIKDTAFKTGVELYFIRENISTGSVGSEPTKNIVVLKFEKLIKNVTANAPMMAGLKKGMVI